MGLLPLDVMSVWEVKSHIGDRVYHADLGQTGAKDRKMPDIQKANGALVTRRQPKGSYSGSLGPEI